MKYISVTFVEAIFDLMNHAYFAPPFMEDKQLYPLTIVSIKNVINYLSLHLRER